MFIKNLKLTNFRNFPKVDLDFGEVTILVGNNAQGKSNLLESIYFLATSKSPRADKDIQLIKEGEGFLRVEGEISPGLPLCTQGEALKLEIGMQKRENSQALEKRVKVNGVGRRTTDYIGNLVIIHFSPEDINLVTGPPVLRRWHLDLTLAQVDKEYKNALNTYHAALVSKNRILKGIKEGVSRVDELDFWDEQMVLSGNLITQKRQDFFAFLNDHVGGGKLGNFRFVYEESLISESRVREYLAREIAAGNSLIGPHRDDFVFRLDDLPTGRQGKDLEYFGSRGEQRTAVLELKLAELKYIFEVKKTLPVLLLDDVFSELDKEHRDYIISIIGSQQTILSAVEEAQVPKNLLKLSQVVRVEKGGITF